MITDAHAEKAVDFIRDHAAEYAKAKSEKGYLQEFRKSKKALLINTQKDGTILEKESFAYAHPEYIEILEAIRAAEEEEIRLLWLMKAAEAKTELWRTQSANNRFVDRSHQ
jgi:hypothetical protein